MHILPFAISLVMFGKRRVYLALETNASVLVTEGGNRTLVAAAVAATLLCGPPELTGWLAKETREWKVENVAAIAWNMKLYRKIWNSLGVN